MTNWGSQFFEIWGGLSFSELGGGGGGLSISELVGGDLSFSELCGLGGSHIFKLGAGRVPVFSN